MLQQKQPTPLKLPVEERVARKPVPLRQNLSEGFLLPCEAMAPDVVQRILRELPDEDASLPGIEEFNCYVAVDFYVLHPDTPKHSTEQHPPIFLYGNQVTFR